MQYWNREAYFTRLNPFGKRKKDNGIWMIPRKPGVDSKLA